MHVYWYSHIISAHRTVGLLRAFTSGDTSDFGGFDIKTHLDIYSYLFYEVDLL